MSDGPYVEPRRGKRIVAAAVMLQSGLVLVGVRHLDRLMQEQAKAAGFTTAAHFARNVQGFVANDYEFYSREESWLIALRAGQFDPKDATGTQGVLYSEDLW